MLPLKAASFIINNCITESGFSSSVSVDFILDVKQLHISEYMYVGLG